ncbi:MAG: DsrE family protein [Thaumarchaeota archaeon]|nr:DsrE family protein [Candidatus Calditenuaceae archaeon]MDW8041563.1 DsrE family protein [Nitrososphaerota archaeon]
MSAEKNRFLFVVSTGANEPKKAFTPFYYAAAAAAMGYETYLFFVAEGPSLLKRESLQSVRTTEDGEPLQKVVDLALKNGVKFLVCSVAAKVIWKMGEDELPPGAQFAGASTLIEMTADPSTAVLYF